MAADDDLDLYVLDSAADILKSVVSLRRRADELRKRAKSGNLQKVFRDVKKSRAQLDIAQGGLRMAQKMLADLLGNEET